MTEDMFQLIATSAALLVAYMWGFNAGRTKGIKESIEIIKAELPSDWNAPDH